MKISKILSLVIFLAFSLSIHCQDLKDDQATSEIASVQLIKGNAELSKASGGGFISLKFDEVIKLGVNDNFTTGEDSRVEIEYPDGSSLVVKSDAEVIILKSGIRVMSGELRISLPDRESAFHVITKANSAQSSKADFILKAEPESAIFSLIGGQLTLTDKIGNRLQLEEGQAIKVTSVGFGSAVGFDENELLDRFDDRTDEKRGAAFSINTLLIGGIVLIILVLSIILLLLRKRHKRPKAVLPSTFNEAPPPPPVKKESPVSPQVIHPVEPKPVEPQPVQPVRKNFCEFCGDRLVEDAKFCTSCGSKV